VTDWTRKAERGSPSLIRLIVWLVIGMVIYFGYSRRHSRVGLGS
jgi:hypothetical protein